MRVRAFILLLCLAVYYLDVMAAVDVCKRMEKEAAGCAQTGGKCSSQSKTQCPRQAADDCSKICVNCPMFFNAVMAPGMSLPLYSIPLGRKFPHYEVDIIYEFFTKAWKPPNSFSI